MKISKNDTVVLITFHGTKKSAEFVDQETDYWKLIGVKGKVVSDTGKVHPDYPDKGERILVQFDCNLTEMGLANHNDHNNSLWIFASDLTTA